LPLGLQNPFVRPVPSSESEALNLVSGLAPWSHVHLLVSRVLFGARRSRRNSRATRQFWASSAQIPVWSAHPLLESLSPGQLEALRRQRDGPLSYPARTGVSSFHAACGGGDSFL
jgi:hypothetical protein